MRINRAGAAIAALCLLLGGLTGCSSTTSGSGSLVSGGSSGPSGSTDGPSDSSNGPSGSTDGPSDTAGPSGSGSGGSDSLDAMLLTASEVGSGFAEAAVDDSQATPLPCTQDDPPLSQQDPPQQRATIGFQTAAKDVQIVEKIYTYADADTADETYLDAEDGFNCPSGTVDGKPTTITDATAFKQPAGADDGIAWYLTNSSFKGTAVVVQVGSKILTLTFVALPNAGGNINAQTITDAATAKLT